MFTPATTVYGRALFVPDEMQYAFGPHQDYVWYEELRGCPYSRAVMRVGPGGVSTCVGWVALPDRPT